MYYIRKRKNLFIKNIKIDAEEKEAGTNNEIVVNSYGKNITPTVLKNKSVEKKIVAKDNFDTFEKIKKLSDLKDQGILTEEEFVSKKKELLERI